MLLLFFKEILNLSCKKMKKKNELMARPDTCMALTFEVTVAFMEFCIFMASTMQHSWPSPTI